MTERARYEKRIAAKDAAIKSLSDDMKRQKEEHKAEKDSIMKEHKAETAAMQKEINDLKSRIAYLLHQLYGRKSEKLPLFDAGQLSLFAEELAELQRQADAKRDEAVKKVEKQPKEEHKSQRRNRFMMEDLPVGETTVLEPEGLDLSLYKRLGEEVTRVVEFEPGRLYIHEYIRPKYVLKDNTSLPPAGQKGVELAPMPLLPIYKGIAGATLLAEILLQKYEYHMPYYRQIKQFAHLGMKGLKENTVDGWFKRTMELLKPLYLALAREVMNSGYNQADETTVPVIDHGREKAAGEYLWMVRAVMERLVIFHYDEGSRAGAVIEDLAKKYHFKGYLQCDGFAGYETAFRTSPDVTLVNCMVHIRRKFEQARDENRPAAEHALTQIQHLYRIEHLCDEARLCCDERRARRQELARPVMEAMKVWMETEGVKYSEASLIGKAITYAYTRWDNMMHYLDDGRLLLDNNLAENEIRPITIGRKNYLFCGNHKAAENMAVVCSLLATCRNHDVNPRLYLNDIIARMPDMGAATHEQLVELLPHRWKLQHPEAVMTKLRDEV